MPAIDPEALRQRIEAEYGARGDSLGWRFLYSPQSVLQEASVAFIGLNPGGRVDEAAHPRFCCTAQMSAYVDEAWAGSPPGRSPLQLQVRALFDALGVAPAEVLAGNLVPFRSPDWNSLTHREEAIAFGNGIWTEVLQTARPRLVVSMGSAANRLIRQLLEVNRTVSFETGWGQMRAERGDGRYGTFVALPHLSQFKLFSRSACRPFLDRLFEGLRL